MNGLLDFIKTPEGQGLLAAVAGGMAGARRGEPVNSLGRAGLAGLAGYSGALDRQDQQANAAFNQQFRQMQMDALKQQQEQQKAQQAWRAGLPDVISQATTPVYGAGEEGPTMAPPDPQKLKSYLMDPASPFADKVLEQKLFPGSSSRDVVVGNELVRTGPNGVTVLHSAPRQESLPSEQRLYNLAVEQGYKGDFMSFLRDRVSTTEGARADLDMVSVPQSDGSVRMMPRSEAVRLTSGGGYAANQTQQTIPTQGNASITPDLMALIQSDAARQGSGEPVIRFNSTTPGAVFGIDTPTLGVSQSTAAAARDKEIASGKAQERESSREAQRASIDAQIAVIDKALSHPGRATATGLSGLIDPRNYIPGTEAKDFQVVLDQLGGAAFLQAFESLKGGGQITEVEGKKATDAIARLNRAQSDKEFEASLRDLRDVMQKGRERLGGGGVSSRWDEGKSSTKPLPPIPQAAINELKMRRNDPTARQQFDGIFGEGAADRVLGVK